LEKVNRREIDVTDRQRLEDLGEKRCYHTKEKNGSDNMDEGTNGRRNVGMEGHSICKPVRQPGEVRFPIKEY